MKISRFEKHMMHLAMERIALEDQALSDLPLAKGHYGYGKESEAVRVVAPTRGGCGSRSRVLPGGSFVDHAITANHVIKADFDLSL